MNIQKPISCCIQNPISEQYTKACIKGAQRVRSKALTFDEKKLLLTTIEMKSTVRS